MSHASAGATVDMSPLVEGLRLSIRLDPASAPDCLDFPINQCRHQNDRIIARLGPDEWFLMASEHQQESVRQELHGLLGHRVCSVVDVSHRSLGIEVTGLHAREVLNGGCPLDLSDAAFPAGSATRTVFGKAEIILLRHTDRQTFRLEAWRSFMPYVRDLLAQLAVEFGAANIAFYAND